MTSVKTAKSQYTESEASSQLGLSVDALRGLIRDHIVKNDEELGASRVANFHPADILLFRLLAQG